MLGDKPGYSVPEFFFVYVLLQDEIFVITVWGYGKRNNVWVVENLTKRSSNTQLRMVRFAATQMLCDISTRIFYYFVQKVPRWKFRSLHGYHSCGCNYFSHISTNYSHSVYNGEIIWWKYSVKTCSVKKSHDNTKL